MTLFLDTVQLNNSGPYLPVTQLDKKFPALYVTMTFTTYRLLVLPRDR